MSVNAMTTYMLYLVDVACENPAAREASGALASDATLSVLTCRNAHNPPPSESNITDPTAFIADFLRFLALSGCLITRTGSERAADALFSHPDVTAFFRNRDNVAALRGTIHTEILPAASQIFRDHWNYIIGPAFDEHCAVAALTTA
jgi:hypothetical protein